MPDWLKPYQFTKANASEFAKRAHTKRKAELQALRQGLPVASDCPNRLPLIQRTIERLSRALSSTHISIKERVSLCQVLDQMLERERILYGKPKPGTIRATKPTEPDTQASSLPVPE
jgi:hypothetical protein